MCSSPPNPLATLYPVRVPRRFLDCAAMIAPQKCTRDFSGVLWGRQAIGVDPDERGLLNVDDFYRTAQPGVYACGDVIGYPALASTSMEQGVRAAHHMWNDQVSPELRGLRSRVGTGGGVRAATVRFTRVCTNTARLSCNLSPQSAVTRGPSLRALHTDRSP